MYATCLSTKPGESRLMNLQSREIGETKELAVAGTRQVVHAVCYRIAVNSDVGFHINIDGREKDEITESITDQTYSFPASFQLLDELVGQGHRILDLGAHVGTFSLLAAALGYSVVSVEASPSSAALLTASARKNGFDNMQVVPKAVSDHGGTLEFISAGPYGLVANPFLEDPTISVPATTVDTLLADIGWDHVDFVKMDVEGAEVAAIRGMSELLAREDAPILLYESNGHTLHYFGETPGSLMAALEQFDYQSYLVEGDRLIPTRAGDLQPEVCVDYLATQRVLDTVAGWRIVGPMSEDERMTRILESLVHPNEHARKYIARALGDADESVISGLQLALLEKDAEIARLRALLEGYERGLFIRTMRTLHDLWNRVSSWMR